MALSELEFDYIRQMVKKSSAIVLEDGKEYLVELRLGILANKEGFPTLNCLISHLSQTADAALSRKVVDAMTTNETFFFRDVKPFEQLRKELLPDMIDRRKGLKELNIWSAACSTGQEIYSVAMVLHKHFPDLVKDWRLNLLATDLSQSCLDYARNGHYNQFEVNRGLPAPYLVRFFNKIESRWHLMPQITNAVSFRELNLIEQWPSLPKMDIIFLSNVLIYFNVETRKAIFEKVRKQLRPDGYLFLGNAETTLNIAPYFERISSTEQANCYKLLY